MAPAGPIAHKAREQRAGERVEADSDGPGGIERALPPAAQSSAQVVVPRGLLRLAARGEGPPSAVQLPDLPAFVAYFKQQPHSVGGGGRADSCGAGGQVHHAEISGAGCQ